MSAMRSMVRLTGCRPPRPGSRPGRVTSMVSLARRASSAASSSTWRRSARALPSASRTRLMPAPAALRSSAGSPPSPLSNAVTLPCLPSRDTLSASSASGVAAAAMSASAWRLIRSISPMGPVPPPQKEIGKDLRPSPCVCLDVRPRTPGGARNAATYLRCERALRLLGQRGKPVGVVHGDVRQHLAVQGDAGLHQAVHEAAVAQAVDAGRGVDAGDPQRAEIALLLLAVDVGVLLGLDDGLVGNAEHLAAGVVVTLGLAQDLLVTAARLHATLDSCHGSALLRDTAACGRDDRCRTPGCGSSGGGCASAWSTSW